MAEDASQNNIQSVYHYFNLGWNFLALSCKFTLAYPCSRPQRPPANTARVCIQPRRDPKKRSKLQASDDDMDSDNPADDDEEEETERSSVGGKGK